jgi:phage integrase family protein
MRPLFYLINIAKVGDNMARGAQGNGTIRQRKDGRWEARVTVGRNPSTGKQIQKSIYGKTQAEVSRKLRELCKEVDDGIYKEPVKYTVKDWAEIWLNEYTGDLKPLTVKQYTTYINNRIVKNMGSVKLTRLDTPIIQRFYNQLTKEGLSPVTIKNIHSILHSMLETAVEVGYMRTNPSNVCRLPKPEKKQIKPLENADISKLLEALKGDKYESLYTVDLFTGLRQGELLGLTWDCIDFKKGTMYIYRQLQFNKGSYYFTSLKNGKTRTIALAPYVLNILRNQKAWQAECQLKSYGMWNNKDDLVFTNELGGHLTQNYTYRHFKKIVSSIGIPDARLHDLRHTFAVSSLQSGNDVKTVQEALGHHTAAFTLDVYGHVTEEMRKASADRLETFINSVKPV